LRRWRFSQDGDPRAGYCVLTLNGDSVHAKQVRLEYDVELACRRLLAASLPEYFRIICEPAAMFRRLLESKAPVQIRFSPLFARSLYRICASIPPESAS
jgi:hypothetical protein